MTLVRPVLAMLLVVLAAACGNAAAAPVTTPSAGGGQSPQSVQLVQRLSEQRELTVHDVSGLTVASATRLLSAQGLAVHPVALRPRARRVTAQWPPAGDPLPRDTAAVIWVGTPQAPPSPPQPNGAAGTSSTTSAATTAAPPPPAPAPLPQAGGPGSGVTPGLEGFVAPPHPPRANIRTLPPASAGTRLAGRASWYGPGFEGRTTACGGTFDPAQLTLASRELRCGTRVVVTGPGARSVEAVVTDWGPAEWTDRRFDLSQATFAAVAGLGAGVIDVSVEVR